MSSRSRARWKVLTSASSRSATVSPRGVLHRADHLHRPFGPVETVHASRLRHPVGVEHHHLPVAELKGLWVPRTVSRHAPCTYAYEDGRADLAAAAARSRLSAGMDPAGWVLLESLVPEGGPSSITSDRRVSGPVWDGWR